MTTELDSGIIARIHDAFNRRDPDAIAAELTEDVVFHAIPGLEEAAPTLHGRDAVVEAFEAQMQLADQRIDHHNAEVLDGYVVAAGTAKFPAASEDRQVLIIDLARLRDGKLAERWAMLDDPETVQHVITEVTGQNTSS